MNLYLAEAVAWTVSLWIGLEVLQEWRWSRRRTSLPAQCVHRTIGDTQQAPERPRPIFEDRRIVEEERKAA